VTPVFSRRMALATGLSAVAAPALAIAPPKDITLQQDFDELWETIRDRYAYFEEKATDWDRVRAIYLPRLAEVGDDEDKWMRLLGSITDEQFQFMVDQLEDRMPQWMTEGYSPQIATAAPPSPASSVGPSRPELDRTGSWPGDPGHELSGRGPRPSRAPRRPRWFSVPVFGVPVFGAMTGRVATAC